MIVRKIVVTMLVANPAKMIGVGLSRVHKKNIILPNPKRKGVSAKGIILISLPIAVNKAIMKIQVREARGM